MANHLQKWELPKISKDDIYHTSIFDFKKNYSIEKREETIVLHNKQQLIRLFDPYAIQKHRQKYEFMHIGLVQVGVKALTHEVGDTSVLLCLRDMRMHDFNDSLLGVLQSSLTEGPVHFSIFPDFMVYLRDPTIMEVLTIYIKFNNLLIKEGSLPFLLTYRIRYKCLSNPLNPAAKKSSPKGRTTFYQIPMQSPNTRVSTTITWSEVDFPKGWKPREETPEETKE